MKSQIYNSIEFLFWMGWFSQKPFIEFFSSPSINRNKFQLLSLLYFNHAIVLRIDEAHGINKMKDCVDTVCMQNEIVPNRDNRTQEANMKQKVTRKFQCILLFH